MNQRAFILRITPSGIDRVPEALSENQIIIGWAKAKGLLNPSLTWEQFREILRQKYYSGEGTFQRAGAAAGHMWRFIREMNKGDLVVVPHRSEFYVAEVEGPTIYHENKIVDDTAYRRPCKWLNSKKSIHRDLAKVGLVSRMKPQGTCTDATDLLDEIKECLRSDSSQQAPIFQNELKPRITKETITERHMQDYLYDNPRVLFPSGNISEKGREYSIHGKRIDLLFVVDGVRYIVEIKNVPIQREHVGQVVEYYGLMKHYMKDTNLAMILVSSSIPPWRATYLEELGIRCVEIPTIPTTDEERNYLQQDSLKFGRKVQQKTEIESVLSDGEKVSFEDVTGPVSPRGIAFAQRMLRGSLEPIRKSFSDYEVVPFSIKSLYSPGFILEYDPDHKYGTREFSRGGIWWAYRFGFSEDLPPNDVPNISIFSIGTNYEGLDVNLLADVQSSQKVMLDRIGESTLQFNRLLVNHGKLWLKTYLKYEHQPRTYHWILADIRCPGEFSGESVLQIRHQHAEAFLEERERWIGNIRDWNKELTERQFHHIITHNRSLNLAMRLVEPFKKQAAFWSLQPDKQVSDIVGAVQRLKPFIDFFIK